MKRLKISLLGLLVFINSCTHFNAAKTSNERTPSSVDIPLGQSWSYDPGPDVNTPMGKELVDLVATQPYMPGISMEMLGQQKFRPAFGPTLWRMILKPNNVKILFIGQDGTHIAEAAGRTATAGFGGRAQDMAHHFGVSTSAAFMNTYAYTIKGQYASFGVPVISDDDGHKKVSYTSVVDNNIWMMSQDPTSPMVQWRNKLIDWIIRNNKDSLKLIVLFGGAAQDAIGSFIESKGAKVGSRYSSEELKRFKIQVPQFESKYAGGNNEQPVALMKNGKDVFTYLGHPISFEDVGSMKKDVAQKAQKELEAVKAELANKIDEIYPQLAILDGGLEGSGIVHPAQIGGYNLDEIVINNKKTISLKSLPLSDGSEIQNDILVAEFPHPTALSSDAKTASSKMAKSLNTLIPMKKQGWKIEPDANQVNKFDQGEPYSYGRTDIPVDYYDFGTPKNRMVAVSSASRMSKNANVVVIGTRDRVNFDMNKIQEATSAGRPQKINSEELYLARPRTNPARYQFDMGPGEKMARIMKENLDMSAIGKKNNAGTFNIKSNPEEVGDFGHYRGTFVNPQVVILADPDGVDDILTSRALTGARGQYLQGLMTDMGINDQYVVIKTVPFAMAGATDAEWKTVLKQTEKYRDAIFNEVLQNKSVKLVIADGERARSELSRMNLNIPQITIKKEGEENGSGILAAADGINALKVFNTFKASGKADVIPRTHLGFFSRVWEGTSGTHVYDTTTAKSQGVAYAVVAPEWAYTQRGVEQSAAEREAVQSMKDKLKKYNLPVGKKFSRDFKTDAKDDE